MDEKTTYENEQDTVWPNAPSWRMNEETGDSLSLTFALKKAHDDDETANWQNERGTFLS